MALHNLKEKSSKVRCGVNFGASLTRSQGTQVTNQCLEACVAGV